VPLVLTEAQDSRIGSGLTLILASAIVSPEKLGRANSRDSRRRPVLVLGELCVAAGR
jgi:hypothetical protein